jgi:hypothetical protein
MTDTTQTDAKKTPSFIIYHVPERDGATWNRIGALWPTRNGTIHQGGIELIPVDVLATGSLRITIKAYEPKEAGA